MSNTIFKIRGRTDTGLLRGNNEDNFSICPDLSRTEDIWIIPEPEPLVLGELGCVMIVADGMGGMNAGEVASAIAVSSIQERFADKAHLKEIKGSVQEVERFMYEALTFADEKINEKIRKDRSTEGMGTTMVLAWIVDGIVFISWCGDSRAYVYNKHQEPRLIRLTKDHSFVQELVDEGKLTVDEAFDHPESNIITRCLGGGMEKPVPAFVLHELKKDDLILLCTDGLCGVCRDSEIQPLFDRYQGDFTQLTIDLIELAKSAGGPDNITVTLMEAQEVEVKERKLWSQTLTPEEGGGAQFKNQKTGRRRTGHVNRILGVALALLCIIILLIYLRKPNPEEGGGKGNSPDSAQVHKVDTNANRVNPTSADIPGLQEMTTAPKDSTDKTTASMDSIDKSIVPTKKTTIVSESDTNQTELEKRQVLQGIPPYSRRNK